MRLQRDTISSSDSGTAYLTKAKELLWTFSVHFGPKSQSFWTPQPPPSGAIWGGGCTELLA